MTGGSLFFTFADILALMVRPTLALGIAPFFGLQTPGGIPRRSFFAIIAAVLLPMLWPAFSNADLSQEQLTLMAMREAVIGLLMGFMMSIAFWAFESAGQVIDLQRGTTAGSLFNPQFGGLTSPTGDVMLRFVVAIFYGAGAFLIVLGALYGSYIVLPPSPEMLAWKPEGALFVVEQMTILFQLTLIYAGPFLILFLLVDSGLGFMNRFVPSLNVFFFSLPVKSALTFLLLIFYLPAVLDRFSEDVADEPTVLKFLQAVLQ